MTVWSLVEANNNALIQNTQHISKSSKISSSFEYSSPWAKVKLIQSAICNLRQYLERSIFKTQSAFDKTKSLFQNNIFSDELLREFSETTLDSSYSAGMQGLRFTGLDVGTDKIYISLNRNFILACSKSLKMERFRKIKLNEGRFLFPTALKVLSNEDFLAVGLSNGSVMILNCNQQKSVAKISKSPENTADSVVQREHLANNAESQELDIGKSCAIQNIILNERRSLDNYQDANYDIRPDTAAFISLIGTQKRPFELRVYDQQLILSGNVLRKDLIKSLELSSNGWHLFALTDGEIRCYDFYLEQEVEQKIQISENEQVLDMCTAAGSKQQYLTILGSSQNCVEVHILKH